MTSLRWYLLGLLTLFGVFVAVEYYRPRPIDWRPTYLSKDKIPYGGYVLFDQLPQLLGTDSIEIVRVAAFNKLTGIANSPDEDRNEQDKEETMQSESSTDDVDTDSATWEADSVVVTRATTNSDSATLNAPASMATAASRNIDLLPARANYLFIDEDINLGAPDLRALLRYVAQGHEVFIAAESFGNNYGTTGLTDSLGFHSTALKPSLPRPGAAHLATDSVRLRFTHPQLRGPQYSLPAASAAYRLTVDAGRRGATLATDEQNRAVLIRLDYGKGHFYLCSVPIAFTNYFLLQPRTTGFAAGALSYLPPRPAWWDEYEKTGPVGQQSLLRVLMAHDALRAALYLTLVGGLLLVLVTARRRQRIIPLLKPLPNTTLLFTRTVASLYRQGSSHALIAEKKVSLFLDYLRTRFQEPNPDFSDEAFRERLAQKAGLPRPRVDELLRLVNFARTAPQITDQELLKLSRALGDFRREARR